MPNQTELYELITNYIAKKDEKSHETPNIALNQGGNCRGFSSYWLMEMNAICQSWEKKNPEKTMDIFDFKQIVKNVNDKLEKIASSIRKYLADIPLTSEEGEEIHYLIYAVYQFQINRRNVNTGENIGSTSSALSLGQEVMTDTDYRLMPIAKSISPMEEKSIQNTLQEIAAVEEEKESGKSISMLSHSLIHTTAIFKYGDCYATYNSNDKEAIVSTSLENAANSVINAHSPLTIYHPIEPSKYMTFESYQLRHSTDSSFHPQPRTYFNIDRNDVAGWLAATAEGLIEDAQTLEEEKIDINTRNGLGESIVDITLQNSGNSLLPKLLSKGANPNTMDWNLFKLESTSSQDDKPLITAIEEDDDEDNVFNHNTKLISSHKTALAEELRIALLAQDVKSVQSALQRGADPNTKDIPTFSHEDNEEIIKAMLEHGYLLKEEDASCPLIKEHLALFNIISDDDFLRAIERKETILNVKNDDGLTLLMQAVSDENIPKIQLLLKHSVDLYAQDYYSSFTCFHMAILNNNAHILEILLNHSYEKSPSKTFKNQLLNVLLIAAMHNNKMDCVKRLLSHGANPNMYYYIDGLAARPLFYAIQSNQKELVQLLLDHKANINYKKLDTYGHWNFPLMTAIEIGNIEIIKILLSQGVILEGINEAFKILLSKKDLIPSAMPLLIAYDKSNDEKNISEEVLFQGFLQITHNKEYISSLSGKYKEISEQAEKYVQLQSALGHSEKLRQFVSLNDLDKIINKADSHGTTLFMYAVKYHPDNIRILLQTKKVLLLLKDKEEKTCFHHAIEANNVYVLNCLLFSLDVIADTLQNFSYLHFVNDLLHIAKKKSPMMIPTIDHYLSMLVEYEEKNTNKQSDNPIIATVEKEVTVMESDQKKIDNAKDNLQKDNFIVDKIALQPQDSFPMRGDRKKIQIVSNSSTSDVLTGDKVVRPLPMYLSTVKKYQPQKQSNVFFSNASEPSNSSLITVLYNILIRIFSLGFLMPSTIFCVQPAHAIEELPTKNIKKM